jgi:hypothetical protein
MKIPQLNFSQSVLLMLIFSAVLIYIIHITEIVYIPFFFMLVFSFVYGILQPRKGWILALAQVIIIISAYWILDSGGIKADYDQTAVFASHVSVFPSFAASFMGGFIRKL